MKNFLFPLLIVFVLVPRTATARQTEVSSVDTTAPSRLLPATLTVRTQTPGVRVILDTTVLGVAPVEHIPLAEGIHILRLIHPDNRSWLQPVVIDTLIVHPGEQIVRAARFPLLYYITSDPYGAKILQGDSVLGSTPLRISLPSGINIIKLIKEGFEESILPLPSEPGEVRTQLIPIAGNGHFNHGSSYLMYDRTKPAFPIYVATGVTVLTGAAAAIFKIKADGYYNDYRATNDQLKLEQVRNFDLAAGISLAASEISLLALTYLLLSR